MEDEPLDRWAARRQGRLRKPGEKKAITLGAGPQRAAHLDPDAPRMILEWDGFAWQALMMVENYAAACRALSPASEAAPAGQPETTGPITGRNPQAPGTGRHRKPRP
ncbi:DUF6087 family protein [Streptomyces xanthophaeus]|uniref:Uncharacterized protein n=1 Tax=Streptomyces xanthophaeus TaxID=67385 RepID=A0A919GZS5_9ACTN|nr:DUF6087 family protein [Streptomyces xanthophaeus]GHI84128.1 hypothetical protein Sxan_14920 [Streptomyces xanthophaeus]